CTSVSGLPLTAALFAAAAAAGRGVTSTESGAAAAASATLPAVFNSSRRVIPSQSGQDIGFDFGFITVLLGPPAQRRQHTPEPRAVQPRAKACESSRNEFWRRTRRTPPSEATWGAISVSVGGTRRLRTRKRERAKTRRGWTATEARPFPFSFRV